MSVTMEGDDFSTKTAAFLSWLSEVGVQMNPKMQLVDLRDQGRGRGVVAVADFEEDEIVFSIPRSTVLNLSTALPSVPDQHSKEEIQAMPNWLALTALMMLEAFQSNSRWAPYLDILPRQLDSLVFWSDTELAELQASTVVNKIGRDKAEEMFSKHIEPLGLENSSMDLSHRVASIIMAYAFDIPDANPENTTSQGNVEDGDDLVSDDGEDERTTLSMIPLADMLNADAERNNARLCCDNADLEMRTIKQIKNGEEIFNDYGQLPRSDLLRRYGYVTEQYASYDVVELLTNSMLKSFENTGTFHLPISQALPSLSNDAITKRVELAEREGIYEDSYDLAHAETDIPSIPDELVALIYLLLLDEESLAAISNSETSLPSRSKLATELVGQVLVQLLQIRDREYRTSVEEDEKLLRAENLPRRTTMAIQVRLGEKKVLRAAVQEAMSFSGSNKRMRGGNMEQSSAGRNKRGADEGAHASKKARFRR